MRHKANNFELDKQTYFNAQTHFYTLIKKTVHQLLYDYMIFTKRNQLLQSALSINFLQISILMYFKIKRWFSSSLFLFYKLNVSIRKLIFIHRDVTVLHYVFHRLCLHFWKYQFDLNICNATFNRYISKSVSSKQEFNPASAKAC